MSRYPAGWERLRVVCYDRDRKANAPCHICKGKRGPIRYDLRPSSDPMAYEPDHLYPFDEYPELALLPENIAAAHMTCNRARGKRAVLDPLGNTSRKWGQ